MFPEIAVRSATGAKPREKTYMPLRARLIALVGAVLLASLACGSTLIAWHAAASVRTELRAALDVGTRTIRNGFDDLSRSSDRAADLRHLIATFNGNRHVRAALVDAQDQPLEVSRLFEPTLTVPDWFRRIIAGHPGAVRLSVPDSPAAVILQAEPVNELGEVWGESRDAVLVLSIFALLSALLICTAVGRALRPLEDLSTAFARIGEGDYHGALPQQGPPELARLATGFNRMTERLAMVAAQNRRLNERLLTLQAEERADLARDLHDEVGPMLFAVDMTAATIERLVETGRTTDVTTHARSIHDAVGRMQRHVRALLERLRPLHAVGLETSIGRLVAFWQARRPEIAFSVTVSVEEDSIGDDVKETIYRVIQEGVSNAIRHGSPTRLQVVATDIETGIRVAVTDDGIGMPPNGFVARGAQRFGLVGMRERVMAMAGSLTIQPGPSGKGLMLVALLPGAVSTQSADQDALQ
jgi:two-component system, NarL family, sensor histidine kinase UhpB